MRYRPDIDGLRAIAVISVVLFHAHLPGMRGGFVGVDIFFVISGFLICSLIAAELRANHFSLARFYERRCRRILPALIAMLAVVAVLAYAVLLPPDMVAFSASLIAALAFISNIYFWRSSNYFDGASQFKPLLHTWSLGVEEQFYIFVPLLMILLARRGKPAYAAPLLALSGVSLALSVWSLSHAPTADFYILPTRFWELASGAVVALVLPARPLARPASELLGAAGFVLIVISVTCLSEVTPFPGWHALLPCLGAAAIIHQGRSGESVVTRLLATRPCVFFGQISYSLYLWHWPLLALARYETATRELTAAEIAGVLLASLLAACVSLRYVERPFREKTGRLRTGVVVAACGAGCALMLIVGVLGFESGGFPGRYPDFAEIRIPGRGAYQRGTCFLEASQTFEAWQGNDCLLTHGHETTVLLWGDSYAAHYAPGILSHADQMSVNLLQYTAVGCPPVFGYYTAASPHCRDLNDRVPELLAKWHIRSVVMAGRWQSILKRGVLAEDVGVTVRRLDALGVRAYVIGQSPDFNNNVQVIFAKQHGRRTDLDAAAPLSFERSINSALRDALAPGIFIDPLPSLCEPVLCRYRRQGQFVVVDEGHFSGFGSTLAVGLYFPFVSDRAP